jgi:hypothetical protein
VVIDLFAHFEQLPDVGELSRIIFSVGIAHELCHFILGLSLDFSSPLLVAVRRFALISARVLQQETHFTFKKVRSLLGLLNSWLLDLLCLVWVQVFTQVAIEMVKRPLLKHLRLRRRYHFTRDTMVSARPFAPTV